MGKYFGMTVWDVFVLLFLILFQRKTQDSRHKTILSLRANEVSVAVSCSIARKSLSKKPKIYL